MRGLRLISAAVLLAGMALTGTALAAPTAPTAAPGAAQSATDKEVDRLIEAAGERLDAGDKAGARRLIEQAAATGHPDALNALGVYTSMGIGGAADEPAAIRLFERAVASGSTGAMLNLGGRLLQAARTPAEQRRGFEMMTRAYADEEIRPLAAAEMGLAYMFGFGVERDLKRGVDLMEEAERGDGADASVLFLLGQTYENGWGGRTNDVRKAYSYFLRAAERDHWKAAWHVGMMLLNGEGVVRNDREAYRWVRKSGEGGDLQGQISTAVMLALGQGVAENQAEARLWYEKAAVRGSAHAVRGLGAMLYLGQGGPVEPARGYGYLELAAEGGDENAGAILLNLDGPEPPRAEIDRHKAAWIAAHGRPRSDD